MPSKTLPSITAETGNKLAIRFPKGIAADKFLILVNYLNYPRGFDLASRSIGVVGHLQLAPEFSSPDATLAGKQAMFYVPSNDTAYDVIRAKVENGAYYCISLTDMAWKPVDEALLPDGAKGL